MKTFGDFGRPKDTPSLPATHRLDVATGKSNQCLDVLQELRQRSHLSSPPEVLFQVLSIRDFDTSSSKQLKEFANDWQYTPIDRSKKLNGFEYLVYVKGDMFDVYKECAGFWLVGARAGAAVGWVWKDHFAIMKTAWSLGHARKLLAAGHFG